MQMDIKTISARKQHSELLQKNTFETPEKRRNNRFFEQLRRLSGVPGLTGAALSLIFAFFAGRIELGGILRPFGAAFVLACFLNARSAYAGGMKMNPYLAMAGVFAALSTRTSTMENIGFAFSVIGTLGALTAGMAITKIPLRRYTVMLAAGASYLVMTFAFLLNSPGSALYMLAECLIVCAFVIVFDNSLKILTIRRKLILTDEETLSYIRDSIASGDYNRLTYQDDRNVFIHGMIPQIRIRFKLDKLMRIDTSCVELSYNAGQIVTNMPVQNPREEWIEIENVGQIFPEKLSKVTYSKDGVVTE